MSLFEKEKAVLRPLAAQIREIAADPIQDEKIKQWKQHTSLHGKKPMVFVHPDGAWQELLPFSSLSCETPVAGPWNMN